MLTSCGMKSAVENTAVLWNFPGVEQEFSSKMRDLSGLGLALALQLWQYP
jgi:hypothetical protein